MKNNKFDRIDKVDKILDFIFKAVKSIIKVLAFFITFVVFILVASGNISLYFIIFFIVIAGIEIWHSEQNEINSKDRKELFKKLKECERKCESLKIKNKRADDYL
jgi:ABC-type bacteriocin/lantibiotic exporter with double-glycine peptidase domain